LLSACWKKGQQQGRKWSRWNIEEKGEEERRGGGQRGGGGQSNEISGAGRGSRLQIRLVQPDQSHLSTPISRGHSLPVHILYTLAYMDYTLFTLLSLLSCQSGGIQNITIVLEDPEIGIFYYHNVHMYRKMRVIYVHLYKLRKYVHIQCTYSK
jgi:hypothetical protein